jgi:phage gp46-like protein
MTSNFRVDPETRDYQIGSDGQWVLDATAQTPMLLALADEKGRWWADLRPGSRIAETFRGVPPRDPVQALAASITEALQPLVESGRLRGFAVEILSETPIRARVEGVDGAGQRVGLIVAPVG